MFNDLWSELLPRGNNRHTRRVGSQKARADPACSLLQRNSLLLGKKGFPQVKHNGRQLGHVHVASLEPFRAQMPSAPGQISHRMHQPANTLWRVSQSYQSQNTVIVTEFYLYIIIHAKNSLNFDPS